MSETEKKVGQNEIYKLVQSASGWSRENSWVKTKSTSWWNLQVGETIKKGKWKRQLGKRK